MPEQSHPSLKRRNHKILESMKRYRDTIDNQIYAAEQVCHTHLGPDHCDHCDFSIPSVMFGTIRFRSCILPYLRDIIPDHVRQDDPSLHAESGPCRWAGAKEGALEPLCLFKGRKGCREMVTVGNIRTCSRIHDR